MKAYAFSLLLLTGLLPACDDDVQPDEVPVEVRQALLSTFPNSSYIEWDKSGKDYEAEFKIDTAEHAALFNASGNLLMHKHQIALTELPSEVTTAILHDFKEYTLDDTEKLLKDGSTYYQMEVGNATREEKLVYSANGQRAQVPFWD